MIKRILVVALSGLLSITAFGFQSIIAQTVSDARRIEDIHLQVAKFGTGQKAKVHVKLRDNTKLKGYVADAGQDSFTVVDSKGPRTVAYADVAEVTKQRGGISALTWGIIAGVAVAAVIVAVTVIKPVLCDGGAGC